MLDVAFVALGLAVLALMGVYALVLRQLLGDGRWVNRSSDWSSPIGLGLYLLYTLIHPEKF